MYVKTISLKNFRNLKDINIELNNGINIFFGDNAQGKTNTLESIYLCATGRSQRTRLDSQLVMFGEREAHIRAFIDKNNREDRIDVHIKKDDKKGIAVNGIPIRKSGDLFGTLHVVIFSPEDLNLIKSGPSERRRFMDMEICQISNVYYYDLQQYYKVLRQRNNLLKNIQKNNSLKDTLSVWDMQLVEFGKKVIKSRTNFIEKINEIASNKHFDITGGKEILKMEYSPNIELNKFENKLFNNIDRDIFTGNTNVGPHKDDIDFFINNIDVKIYGSQGQQRTAALSAKLAEIDIIRQETGLDPVLLLDDVLSELDENRQMFLLNTIEEIQTIITCTGIEDTIKKYEQSSFIFEVKNGVILKVR